MNTYLILVQDVMTVHCCRKRKEKFEDECNIRVLKRFPQESDIDVRKWHCGFDCLKKRARNK